MSIPNWPWYHWGAVFVAVVLSLVDLGDMIRRARRRMPMRPLTFCITSSLAFTLIADSPSAYHAFWVTALAAAAFFELRAITLNAWRGVDAGWQVVWFALYTTLAVAVVLS